MQKGAQTKFNYGEGDFLVRQREKEREFPSWENGSHTGSAAAAAASAAESKILQRRNEEKRFR